MVVALQPESELSWLEAERGTPGQRVENSLAGLGGDPEKVLSFRRQKLKFVACSDDEIFSVSAFSTPAQPW